MNFSASFQRLRNSVTSRTRTRESQFAMTVSMLMTFQWPVKTDQDSGGWLSRWKKVSPKRDTLEYRASKIHNRLILPHSSAVSVTIASCRIIRCTTQLLRLSLAWCLRVKWISQSFVPAFTSRLRHWKKSLRFGPSFLKPLDVRVAASGCLCALFGAFWRHSVKSTMQ